MFPMELSVVELCSHYGIDIDPSRVTAVSPCDWSVKSPLGDLCVTRVDVDEPALLRSINLCHRLVETGFSNLRLPLRTTSGAHAARLSSGLFIITEAAAEWPARLKRADARAVGELLARLHVAATATGLQNPADVGMSWPTLGHDFVPELREKTRQVQRLAAQAGKAWPEELHAVVAAAPRVLDQLADSVVYQLHLRECQLAGAVVHGPFLANSWGRGAHGQLLLMRPVTLRPGVPLEDLVGTLHSICGWEPSTGEALIGGYRSLRWPGRWEWPVLELCLQFPWELVKTDASEEHPGAMVRMSASRHELIDRLFRARPHVVQDTESSTPVDGPSADAACELGGEEECDPASFKFEPDSPEPYSESVSAGSGQSRPPGVPGGSQPVQPGPVQSGQTQPDTGAPVERKKLVWKLPPPKSREDHNQ